MVVLNSVKLFTSVCSKHGTLLPAGLLHRRLTDAVALVLVRTDGQIFAHADTLRVLWAFTWVLHEALYLPGDGFVDGPAAHRVAGANLCLVLGCRSRDS